MYTVHLLEWLDLRYQKVRFREMLSDTLLIEFVHRKSLVNDYKASVEKKKTEYMENLLEASNQLTSQTEVSKIEDLCREIRDLCIRVRMEGKVFSYNQIAKDFCRCDAEKRPSRKSLRVIEEKEAERTGFVLLRGSFLDKYPVDVIRQNEELLALIKANYERFEFENREIYNRILGEVYMAAEEKSDNLFMRLQQLQERVEEILKLVQNWQNMEVTEKEDGWGALVVSIKEVVLFGGNRVRDPDEED